MKSGSRGHNLINVELTTEGVEAVANAVIQKLPVGMWATTEDFDLIAVAVIRKLRDEGLVVASHSPAVARVAPTVPGNSPLNVPETGFLRLSEILKFIPVGKTKWWEGVKSGKFPPAVKISERVTAWRAEDIRELLTRIGNGAR